MLTKRGVLTFVVLAIVALPALAHASGDPALTTFNGERGRAPVVAVEDQRVCLAWDTTTSLGGALSVNSSIGYTFSTDGGTTFAPLQHATTASPGFSAIRATQNGCLLLWSRRTSSKELLLVSRFGGAGGFQTTQLSPVASDDVATAKMFIDGSTVTVTWHQIFGTGGGAFASASLDGGQTWSDAVSFDFNVDGGLGLDGVAYAGGGVFYAVTSHYSEDGIFVYIGSSTDGGQTWSEPWFVDDCDGHRVTITADGTGVYIAVAHSDPDGSNASLAIMRSHDGGFNWQRTTLPNDNDWSGFTASEGVLYLWNSSALFTSTDGGVSFAPLALGPDVGGFHVITSGADALAMWSGHTGLVAARISNGRDIGPRNTIGAQYDALEWMRFDGVRAAAMSASGNRSLTFDPGPIKVATTSDGGQTFSVREIDPSSLDATGPVTMLNPDWYSRLNADADYELAVAAGVGATGVFAVTIPL